MYRSDHDVNITLQFLYSYPEPCTVLCLENNREYACNTSSLSTDSRDYVTQDDLEPGKDLIWVYRGIHYSVIFKHLKGILYMYPSTS